MIKNTRLRKAWKFCWRWVKIALVTMFLSSLVYIVICKWVFPPITVTQISNTIKYGIYKEYVPWNQISNNVKLAALASEDQTFLDHSGLDWDAIEKSLRPPKKGRKQKHPAGAGASTISQQVAKNVFLWQGTGWTRYLRKIPEVYFTKTIEWMYRLDPGGNALPSSHAYTALLCSYYLTFAFPLHEILIWSCGATIVGSTLFVKQHHVSDLIAGGALAALSVGFSYLILGGLS